MGVRAGRVNIVQRLTTVFFSLALCLGSSQGLLRGTLNNNEFGAAQSSGRRIFQAPSPQCAKSWLGYQCTELVCGPKGRIRIHWSLGGPPPSGPGCSYVLDNGQQVAAPEPQAQLLHMAVQSDITGYVAASWPKHLGEMQPADAVVGYKIGNVTSVGGYNITGFTWEAVKFDAEVAVTNTAVDINATTLTMCFTRNLTQKGKVTGVEISPAAPVAMNFVASRSAFPQAHSHSKEYQCGHLLTLLRTPGGPYDGGWRPSNVTGDPAEGEALEQERLEYMRAHGALEFTGWIALVPLGILAARHRWLFSNMGVVGLWFQVHRVVQSLALVLVLVGFILPWTTFNSNDTLAAAGINHNAEMAGDSLLEVHENLATALVAVLGAHFVLAVLRPKPDAHWRRAWNLVHWWTGRCLALLAGVNVAVGITLWRRVSGGTGVEWIIPYVLLAVAWVGLAFWLERRAPEGHGREGSTAGSTGVDSTYLTSGLDSSSQRSSSPPGEVPMARLGLGGTAVPYNKL